MNRGGAWLPVLAITSVLFSACEPPGKPKLEQQTQEITDFQFLFSENCAGCHGLDGKNGPGRILNDPLYLALIPRETLKDVIVHGRPGTAMPAWAKSEGGPLTPQQVDALVDGIEKNWAKPVDFHGTEKLAYAASARGNADAGRKLFLRSCFMCHGPGARVGSVNYAAYLQLVSDQMLRTSILVGRPDLGMPDYRHLKMGKALTDADVNDIVAFLVSKRPAQKAAEPIKGQESAESNKTRASSQQGIK